MDAGLALVCKEFKIISRTHLKYKHSTNIANYIANFPDATTTCKKFGESISVKIRAENHYCYGKSKSEETKNKISNILKEGYVSDKIVV